MTQCIQCAKTEGLPGCVETKPALAAGPGQPTHHAGCEECLGVSQPAYGPGNVLGSGQTLQGVQLHEMSKGGGTAREGGGSHYHHCNLYYHLQPG